MRLTNRGNAGCIFGGRVWPGTAGPEAARNRYLGFMMALREHDREAFKYQLGLLPKEEVT
jgi:hypothetical protein